MSTTTSNKTEQTAAASPPQAGEQAKAIVKIEGQDVPIAERIAADDNLLKKALRRFYHSITNATITRKREGGRLIVTVVKRADYKGRETPRGAAARDRTPQERVLDAIKRAREHTNPALVLARDLQLLLARGRTTHTALARRDAEIEAAIEAGAKEVESTRAALRRIKECRPVATADTPEGF